MIQDTVRSAWPMRDGVTGFSTQDGWPILLCEERAGHPRSCIQHDEGSQEASRDSSTFAFESLESLWDPHIGRRDRSRAQVNAPPLPRAVYELDCQDWLRAPLSADGIHRGIVQLACLVSNPSLHVYSDFDRAFHVNLFAIKVDNEIGATLSHGGVRRRVAADGKRVSSVLKSDDDAILADSRAMDAVARAARVSMLIDGGGPGQAHLCVCASAPASACSWLVRDTDTKTWTARVFGQNALSAPLGTVRTMAFMGAIQQDTWESTSTYHDMLLACRRAGIKVPARVKRIALVEHIRLCMSQEPPS